jgi:hypothetical protein
MLSGRSAPQQRPHWEEAKCKRIAGGGHVAAAGLNGSVTFGTGVAQHTFRSDCGMYAFYKWYFHSIFGGNPLLNLPGWMYG